MHEFELWIKIMHCAAEVPPQAPLVGPQLYVKISCGLRRLPLELAWFFVFGLIMLVARLRHAPRGEKGARGQHDNGNTTAM